MQHQKFRELIEKYLDESADAGELQQLAAMLEDPAYGSLLDETVLEQVAGNTFKYDLDDAVRKRIDQGIYQKTLAAQDIPRDEPSVTPIRRVHFLKKWGWVAAAVLLLGIMVTIAVFSNRSSNPAKNDVVLAPVDILPGTNKAVLTVDDKQINLSADKTGIQVGEKIAYTDGEQLSETGKMLMLTTPNGGQYQLVLPDGTKVWLNAASSISFPAVFKEENRQVKITGEVYLEVAKDKAHPFLVDVADKSEVEVLGTHFNINSYGDDGSIRTTLLEGSVKVGSGEKAEGKGQKAKNGYEAILKPGEQAILSQSSQTSQVIPVQTEEVMAWKNGLFNFNQANLKMVMAQLSRWYDIDVKYEGEIPARTFRGKITRDLKLSQVIKILEEVGVQFKIEGRTLVVMP